MRPLPAVLVALVKRFEGLRLKAYLCPAGVPTIGYGSTGTDVKLGMTTTPEAAEARMRRDLASFQAAAISLCPVLAVASDPRLAAITDFAYNLGSTRLKSSTLRKRINAQDWEGAMTEIRKWNRAGGRVLKGLTLRREAEAVLLQQG